AAPRGQGVELAGVNAQPVARAQDQGDVRDVRETELAAGEVRLRVQDRVQLRQLGVEALTCSVLVPPQRVVGLRELVEAEDEEAPEGALRRVGRPQGRLWIALLEVLVDHGRLRQDEGVLFENRHTSERVLLVDPRRPVVQVDLDRLVLDPLLRERDSNARAVRTPVGVVERDHRSILASRFMTAASCSSSSRAGGKSAVVDAVRATARTLAGSAPVRRATSVAFAASDSSSAL